MANKHGEFIWYELLTSDSAAAQPFYEHLLGWEFSDGDQSGIEYRIATAHDPETQESHGIAGMMTISAEMREGGARPVWMGYIGVDDVDKTVVSIESAGGQVHVPPTDIPDVGRFAMVTDPQGVPFYVMRGASDENSLAFAADRPRVGHCAWNELATTDPAAARAFYESQFGWTKDGEMDMGPAGAYEFMRHNGVIGAIMPKFDEIPQPMWRFYFRVSDIHAAMKRAEDAGATMFDGPHEIPGGDFICHGTDPQGAVFCLVGKGAVSAH